MCPWAGCSRALVAASHAAIVPCRTARRGAVGALPALAPRTGQRGRTWKGEEMASRRWHLHGVDRQGCTGPQWRAGSKEEKALPTDGRLPLPARASMHPAAGCRPKALRGPPRYAGHQRWPMVAGRKGRDGREPHAPNGFHAMGRHKGEGLLDAWRLEIERERQRRLIALARTTLRPGLRLRAGYRLRGCPS